MADIRDDDKLYAATHVRTTIGTTELPVFLAKMPNVSGNFARIKQIVLSNNHTVASFIRYRFYVSPTISANGTALTESRLDIGGTAVANLTAFGTPTISANGTQLMEWIVPAGISSSSLIHTFPDGFNLRANQNILITAVADGTTRIAAVSLIWEE
jgi:hypothetical protein